MKVRIKKCGSDKSTYKNLVGETFDVFTDCDGFYALDVNGRGIFVEKQDCEVVDEAIVYKENASGDGCPPKFNRSENKQTMEKQIKMSIETAIRMYNDVNLPNYLTPLILENFTKEELEPKKGFTWEDSYEAEGYCITMDGSYKVKGNGYKSAFKTREQAESALAFAQLSHIVAKYNEGKMFGFPGEEPIYYYVTKYNGKDLCINNDSQEFLNLPFCDFEDAKTSMEVNVDLWKKYWMLK